MKKIIIIKFLVILFMITSCNQGEKEESSEPVKGKLILSAKAKLGEGAIWHPGEKKLYWVDIDGGYLHVFDPRDKTDKEYYLGQKVGTVVPIDTGGVLVALKTGVFMFNLSTGELNLKTPLEDEITGNRLNDGKCDPEGRFWVGSMSLTGKDRTGGLYRIDKDFSYKKMLDKVYISNGITWSRDGKNMYYIDTPTKIVMKYDFDSFSGNISNPKPVIYIPDSLGYPDGSTIDSEGKLWIAMWGGACVTRWDPGTGKLLEKIDVPAINVTSCAFGGDNLKTLYITSASVGLNQDQQIKYPLSGGLFAVNPGVKGVEADLFKQK